MAVAVYTSLLTLDEAPSGTVTVQDAGTTNIRNIYTDTALSVGATNPIPLNSAGRATQGIIYTAATAYKVIVKNAAGTTLYTRDNIDPGVPIGSGFLAIANGGTGATVAATALTNLGGVSAATVADLEAQVAALAGAAGSTEKTSIAVGTTDQRPASPEVGDIRYNSTTEQYEVYTTDDIWDNPVLETANLASTTDIAAESTDPLLVRPNRMKAHPGVAKAWARVEAADSSPSYVDSWGFSGAITDHGAGEYTLTFTTALANANYVASITPRSTGSARCGHVHTQAAGSVRVLITATDGTATDTDFLIVIHGDF
jgi:hypothetical protein